MLKKNYYGKLYIRTCLENILSYIKGKEKDFYLEWSFNVTETEKIMWNVA